MAVVNKDTFTGASLPLSDRLRRLCWNGVQATLFRWSPRPCHEWRSFLLRLFGARIGRGVHVYPRAIIWAPWNVEIGDESGFADTVQVYSQARIQLGRRVVVSQGARLAPAPMTLKLMDSRWSQSRSSSAITRGLPLKASFIPASPLEMGL